MRPRKNTTRLFLLVMVAFLLIIGILSFSARVLPDPPLYPTPTFPEGIEYPNERPVPYR